MYRKPAVYKRAYNLHYGLILLAILCAFLFSARPAFADSMPGGNVADPAVRAVDIAKPAVVRIITTINGHLKVHFPPTTDVSFPQVADGSYPVQISGTGTFITAQGDILTADHVVTPVQDKTLNQSLYTQAAPDITTYMNQNAKPGSAALTKEDVLTQLSSGQLQSTVSYDTASSMAYLSTDYTGPLSAADLQSLPANTFAKIDHIEKESGPDQQDLAIVHVPMTDTPNVQLGDSSNVHPQDSLTIIGFPGSADVGNKPNTLLTTSINTISVSSIKARDNGTPLIQVGGNVEAGDSGGPALDSQGHVVGVVSFRLASADSGGTSFLQASNSARDMVTGLNLVTQPGTFQTLWNQAFNDYAATTADHWTKAQQGFAKLAQNYPPFKAVQPYQQYAQTQALATPVVTPTATAQSVVTPTARAQTPGHPAQSTPAAFPALAVTIGAVVLVLILIGSLFVLNLRPVRKRIKATQGTPQPAKSAPDPVSAESDTKKESKAVPPVATAKPVPPPVRYTPPTTQNTLALKIWPCGHMNRPNARFCSICGELAPESADDTTTQPGKH